MVLSLSTDTNTRERPGHQRCSEWPVNNLLPGRALANFHPSRETSCSRGEMLDLQTTEWDPIVAWWCWNMKLTFTWEFSIGPLEWKQWRPGVMLLCSQWSSAKVKRPRYSAASNSVISGASMLAFDGLFPSWMRSYSTPTILEKWKWTRAEREGGCWIIVAQQRNRIEPTANIGA